MAQINERLSTLSTSHHETRKAKSKRGRDPTPQSAPAPTISDDWDVSGLTLGDTVLAKGFSPTGQRLWYQATITAFRSRPAWPPIVVKFKATEDGNTQKLLLPQPITAYVHRGDIKLL